MELSLTELHTIMSMGNDVAPSPKTDAKDPWIGEYVIVRCRDAGVHAGYLVSRSGRECELRDARRLWYWKPANGAAFLSGVAKEGLHKDSKIGAGIRMVLTENCEIIECSEEAKTSIQNSPDYKP